MKFAFSREHSLTIDASTVSPGIFRWKHKIYMSKRSQILLRRSIFPFTWPIMVELSSVIFMAIISTILVSHIGSSETAAVGISDSVTFLFASLFSAAEIGCSVLIAQAFGRHHRDKALNVATHAINLNIIVGTLSCFFIYLLIDDLLKIIAIGAENKVIALSGLYLKTIAFSYPALAILFAGSGALRAVGNTRAPAMATVIMNILNIVFSLPLIYGVGQWEGWGLFGAGIGVTFARWSGAVIIIAVLARDNYLTVHTKDYCRAIHKATLMDILSIGIPASVESLMFNVGKLMTQMMVASMGTVIMAGNVISFSIAMFINLPANALAMAGTVLVGKRIGQGLTRLAKKETYLIVWSSTILITIIGLLAILFARSLAVIYTQDPQVIEVVVHLIYLSCSMMVAWSAAFVLPSAFRGAKDVKYSMWTAIASMWGCRVFMGYLLGIVFNMSVYGIWLGMCADWWVRAGLYLYRMTTDKWLIVYRKSAISQKSR